jgi:S1-C subfamily serine protease
MGMFKSPRSADSLSTRTRWLALAAVAVVMVVVIGVLVSACGGTLGSADTTAGQGTATTATAAPGSSATTAPSASSGTTTPTVKAQGEASPAVDVAKVLGPSVVNLKVQFASAGGNFGFGQQQQPDQQYSIQGSGVIYRSDGMIITNNHMVSDPNTGDVPTAIKVTLATGEVLDGTLVGRDPLTEIAVIKVSSSKELPAAKFVGQLPTVGEYAVAIGSPLGYENSVTLGIVSGVSRKIEGTTGSEGAALSNLIQTDAPISPGNSGGALGNASGQVIGINVAYESPAGGAVSIGFAVPAVTATSVADQIINTGKVAQAYLGIGPLDVTPDLQQQYGLSRSSGVLIAEIAAGGPAEAAGLKQGDIIIKADGKDVTDSSSLYAIDRDKKPGDQVQLTIDRNGQEQTVTVTLGERPANIQ